MANSGVLFGDEVVKKPDKKLSAFSWYGGKFSHLNFILPIIPEDTYHFCDVFGGSASVVMNAGPFPIETYNDLDSDIVNFFEVLRNDGERLVDLLRLTPHSREELDIACQENIELSSTERARRFYVKVHQSIFAQAQIATKSFWRSSITKSRNNKTISSVTYGINNSIENLPMIIDRFRKIQIENIPATHCITKYDTSDTVFYVDPPYVHATRKGSKKIYKNEMTNQDHIELSEKLHSIEGRAILSGYKGDLYDDLYANWKRIDGPEKILTNGRFAKASNKRQESVWVNF